MAWRKNKRCNFIFRAPLRHRLREQGERVGRNRRRRAAQGWGAAGEPSPAEGPRGGRTRGRAVAGHRALSPQPSSGPAVPCRAMTAARRRASEPRALPRTAAWCPPPALPPRPTAGEVRRAAAAPLPGPPSPPWPGEGSGPASGPAPPRPGVRGSRDRAIPGPS